MVNRANTKVNAIVKCATQRILVDEASDQRSTVKLRIDFLSSPLGSPSRDESTTPGVSCHPPVPIEMEQKLYDYHMRDHDLDFTGPSHLFTVGYELVPSLQSDFATSNNTIPFWSKSPRLPNFLTRTVPLCQPKDLGRGDRFRLSPSLFEYRVLSSWRTNASHLKPQDEGRFEYKGGSFSKCSVYEMLFDHSTTDRIQTVTAGIMCPSYPVRLYMEARVPLSLEVSKDIVGQYYGYDVDMDSITDEDSRDYRQSVFGILDAVSTDSLGIMLQQHLSAPLDSISFTGGAVSDTNITFHPGGTIVYQNGTMVELNRDNDLAEAEMYRASITNIMIVVHHAVELDLGNPSPGNIFMNPSVVNATLAPNTAPVRINPELWMGNRSSYAYGYVAPPFQTWAQMIRAGLAQGIALGNLTGLPPDSKMVTEYMCPIYRLKPISTLLANVFIGTVTMFLSVWAAWMTLSGMIARRMEHCMACSCDKSSNRLSELSTAEKGVLAMGNINGIQELPQKEVLSTVEKGVLAMGDINGIREIPRNGVATGPTTAA